MGSGLSNNNASVEFLQATDVQSIDTARIEIGKLRASLKNSEESNMGNNTEKKEVVANEREVLAATKLQSSYRAHRVRKAFKETDYVELKTDNEGNEIVNQYIMVETLGSGAFGTVKKAKSKDDGEFYAIKVLNKKKLKRKRVGRFGNALQTVAREIAIWKKLDHANVVPLYEVIDSKMSQSIYLVSALVDGGAVMPDDLVCDPLPASRAQKIFRGLIAAVDYLHFQNVVHRDIKPGNILSTKDDHVFLTDFGVSRVLETSCAELVSSDGTAAFAAP